MNKTDIYRIISVKKDLPIQQAEKVVDEFFAALADGMKDSKRIEIRGFGSFEIREYDGYMGRNPKTGESVTVSPKRVPFFKMGKEIKDAINK